MRRHWHGPLWWIVKGALNLLVRGAPSASARGVTVYFRSNIKEGRRQIVLERVAAALSLIDRHDPRRLMRLKKGHTALLVSAIGKNLFAIPANLIVLDLGGVEAKTDRHLASTLVHEATHARIALAGVPQNRHTIARIEQRCLEEQIAFVRRLPNTDLEALRVWELQMRELHRTRWWALGNMLRARERS